MFRFFNPPNFLIFLNLIFSEFISIGLYWPKYYDTNYNIDHKININFNVYYIISSTIILLLIVLFLHILFLILNLMYYKYNTRLRNHKKYYIYMISPLLFLDLLLIISSFLGTIINYFIYGIIIWYSSSTFLGFTILSILGLFVFLLIVCIISIFR